MSTETLVLDGADGFPIRLRALSPVDPSGSVVICHGFKGFMDWGFFPWLAERITAAGLRAISFDFSGSGMTPDGEFVDQEAFESNTFGRELRDLQLVITEGRNRGWLDGGYGLFGHSRGGGIAVLHADRERDVRALVTWSAISRVRRWSEDEVKGWRERGYLEVRNSRTGELLRQDTATLEEVEREEHGALDIAAAASRVRVPWLIIHGHEDETVNVSEARRLRDAASAGIARLELIETNHVYGVGHPMRERSAELERAVALTVDFLATHLK